MTIFLSRPRLFSALLCPDARLKCYHPFDGRVRSHLVKRSEKYAITKVSVVSDVV